MLRAATPVLASCLRGAGGKPSGPAPKLEAKNGEKRIRRIITWTDAATGETRRREVVISDKTGAWRCGRVRAGPWLAAGREGGKAGRGEAERGVATLTSAGHGDAASLRDTLLARCAAACRARAHASVPRATTCPVAAARA